MLLQEERLESLWTDFRVCPITASASLRSCWTSTARSLLCETQRRRLWHPKLNFQLLSGSVFFSTRRLIEVSLWAAPLPIYFPIIPADKYFDVSMFCGGGVKVSLESHTKRKKGSMFLIYHLQIKLIPASVMHTVVVFDITLHYIS